MMGSDTMDVQSNEWSANDKTSGCLDSKVVSNGEW